VEADRPGHAFSLSRLSLDWRICFGRRVFVLYQGTTLSRAGKDGKGIGLQYLRENDRHEIESRRDG
jgi:hypothetical protein